MCPSSWVAQGRLAECESCVLPGEGGIDGDGDITRPENVTAFRNFVLDNTDRKGVHFLMADGVGDLLSIGLCFKNSSCCRLENLFLFGPSTAQEGGSGGCIFYSFGIWIFNGSFVKLCCCRHLCLEQVDQLQRALVSCEKQREEDHD